MRRIIIWLASTVTVVVLLFGYHTSTNKTTSGTTEGGTSGSTTSAGNEPGASPSSPSSGSSGSPSTKITTYTGAVTQTRWGPVQVKITMQRRNHTLQAPSIDIVCRTTMTSGGYVQSLQPALGEAGI
jgi:hypothetical protein